MDFILGRGRCIDLEVPQFVNRREAEITARVGIHGNKDIENFPMERKTLKVLIKNSYLVISTDKPIYKPGQTGVSQN